MIKLASVSKLFFVICTILISSCKKEDDRPMDTLTSIENISLEFDGVKKHLVIEDNVFDVIHSAGSVIVDTYKVFSSAYNELINREASDEDLASFRLVFGGNGLQYTDQTLADSAFAMLFYPGEREYSTDSDKDMQLMLSLNSETYTSFWGSNYAGSSHFEVTDTLSYKDEIGRFRIKVRVEFDCYVYTHSRERHRITNGVGIFSFGLR